MIRIATRHLSLPIVDMDVSTPTNASLEGADIMLSRWSRELNFELGIGICPEGACQEPPPPASVPTMTEWGMILFVTFFRIDRRFISEASNIKRLRREGVIMLRVMGSSIKGLVKRKTMGVKASLDSRS